MNATKINENKLKELYDSIIMSKVIQSQSKFQLFTYEASRGKTTTIIKALKDLHISFPDVKTLVVTKLIAEQDILKEKLGDIAYVVNSENKVKEEELHKQKVLIITHELYIRLCKDYKRRQHYIKDRTNLIIDEQLDLLEVREFSSSRANEIREKLNKIRYCENGNPCDLGEIYGKVIISLNETMNQNYQKEMKFVNIEDDEIIIKIDNLKNMLEQGNYPRSLLIEKENIMNEIDFIRHFYNNKNVIACNGKLNSHNSQLRYFMLNHNIMLDASGSFMEIYNQSDKFKVEDFGRVINHSNTTLTFIEENSTSSTIERDPDKYFKGISQYIKDNTTKGDKVLIIGRKTADRVDTEQYLEDILNLKDRHMEFVNFHAMRGKNDWADFNKCFIIHTPNLPFHHYIYQYLYYTDEELTQDDIKLQKMNTNFGFMNSEILEKFKITDVVSDIYQGLKRVNRKHGSTAKCDLYVVTSNKGIQDLIEEQFKGLKDIKSTRIFDRKYDNNQRRKDSLEVERANKIDGFFKGMIVNQKVKKTDIRKFVDIKDRKKFARALAELGGTVYLKTIGIEEVGHSYLKIS